MPRKAVLKSSSPAEVSPIGVRKVQKSDQWAGFAQVNIGDSERESFDDWRSRVAGTWWALLQDELASGLKLTLVWDGANDCFIASLTGRPDCNGMSEWTACLSARAGEMDTALSLLLYKHLEVTGGDWSDWLINGPKTKRSFG